MDDRIADILVIEFAGASRFVQQQNAHGLPDFNVDVMKASEGVEIVHCDIFSLKKCNIARCMANPAQL